ncbi:sodium:alanine symporter family protein [Thioalkalivibrio sp. XN279]|uniref:alanine/glycine:cation symporter family protein n=1 Tax=Thioalkalivibrio sp. XN279 TaxID=2714953 RepID=UPI00197F77B9|nr:sodium:alanine symporter family protein [Thioalkalivibrio sp. XN279]
MTAWLDKVSAFVWGPYCLIPLLLLTGLYLTVLLRGLQFRQLGPALHQALIVRTESGARGDISHFAALMTAMAATVGTGNIVGVATAIALGGPGALFWMWVTGLVGMATKYSEALLSVKYRVTNERGEQAGGPMYYLSEGIRWKPLGRTLGWLFALFTACAAFGIGNMVQSNSVADAIGGAFGIPAWVSGAVIALGVAAVTLGGIRAIGGFTSLFVPAMIVIYMGACTIVLAFNFSAIPAAFALVFTDAFTGSSAAGGFLGATIAQAMRYGVARGIFSNESGLGSAGIAAASAQTREPVRQALVSMTQTFIDTLVVCTFTGIAIIASGAWTSGANGAALTQLAFGSAMPGPVGPAVVAICLALFAFSTIVGWSHYGSRGIEYILGVRAILPYRILFVLAAFAGSVYTLDFVWLLSDVMNGLMALPNLVGLLLLSGVVAVETRSYFARGQSPMR